MAKQVKCFVNISLKTSISINISSSSILHQLITLVDILEFYVITMDSLLTSEKSITRSKSMYCSYNFDT